MDRGDRPEEWGDEVADVWCQSGGARAQDGRPPADVIAELERREGTSGIEEKALRKASAREREESAAPAHDWNERIAREWLTQWQNGDLAAMHRLLSLAAQDAYPFETFQAAYQRADDSLTFASASVTDGTGIFREQDSGAIFNYNATFHTRLLGDIADANRDLTLHAAYDASVYWYYRETVRRIGPSGFKHWLDTVGYGNADTTGGFDQCWVQGGLRITPRQQVIFLRKVHDEQLPFSARTYAITQIEVAQGALGRRFDYGTLALFTSDAAQPVHLRDVPNPAQYARLIEEMVLPEPVSYTHLRAHETVLDLVCRLLLEKKNSSTPSLIHMSVSYIAIYSTLSAHY